MKQGMSPHSILNEFLNQVWRENGWPQQQMSREKWEQLSSLLLDPAETKINLPGNLMAKRLGHRLTIWEA